MTREEVAAIRRLDIAFAQRRMLAERGYPFLSGTAEATGKFYTSDEMALIALHNMRAVVGSKAEARASKAWLRAEGLDVLVARPLG